MCSHLLFVLKHTGSLLCFAEFASAVFFRIALFILISVSRLLRSQRDSSSVASMCVEDAPNAPQRASFPVSSSAKETPVCTRSHRPSFLRVAPILRENAPECIKSFSQHFCSTFFDSHLYFGRLRHHVSEPTKEKRKTAGIRFHRQDRKCRRRISRNTARNCCIPFSREDRTCKEKLSRRVSRQPQ